MPLGELVTLLINDLQLNTLQGEFPYLLGFQDAVRQFSQKQRNDISRFLEWWKEEGGRSSITLPESQGSARILTIHKAKGLEFRVVIIPFCTWKFDPDSRKNNILWLEAGKTLPGLDISLPVKYSKNLQETFYSTEYYHERSLSYIDNLNLMYVAFTRASEALFIFAPAPKSTVKESKPNSADKLLFPVLESLTGEDGEFKISKQATGQGEATINYLLGNFDPSRSKHNPQAELTLGDLSSSRWQTRLSFRKSADNIFSENEASGKSQLDKGIAVHAILSAIIRAGDLPRAFENARSGGIFDPGQEEEIRHSIEKIIQMPEVAEWFSGNWEVRTEAPVIPAPGELNRMDRVMIRGQKAIVVDYKTGKPSEKDRIQVEEYKRILKEMDYQEVEGYLLYTDEGKLVKI